MRSYCEERAISYREACISTEDPPSNWRTIHDTFSNIFDEHDQVLLDISTMPREIIWYMLWMSEVIPLVMRYVYHSPKSYTDGWLSRDPRSPRLVYKLSGISIPGARTALLVTAGFDYERIKRLVDWYEPAMLVIGVQMPSLRRKGEVLEDEFRDYFRAESEFHVFEMNALTIDGGIKTIWHEVERIGMSFNLLMSSLGPKITAISLYRIQRSRPSIGLVYTPSNEYNEQYSNGIGESYWGSL